MFYDLEDPSKFISDAAKSLDDDGYFTTDIELLDVGENRFAIFFCKNYSGEIVEFISLENK